VGRGRIGNVLHRDPAYADGGAAALHADCRHRSTAGAAITTLEGVVMLHYAVVFLVIALIAALFGFGGIAASAAGIAQILFFIFIVLAIASFLLGTFRRR
jgi:uncharacterized membrane protein YtjA (UPF0391 family)